MGRRKVERQLRQTGARLRQLREELRIIDDQLEQLADEAEDSGVRALVSESPSARHDFNEATASAQAMSNHRVHVVRTIAELERHQDELLDQLTAG